MRLKQILNAPLETDDCDATTIKEYLHEIMLKLWQEGESFSGKRPFGNGGWKFDIYVALVKCGAVEGKLDEDGFLDEVDLKAADKLVFKLIDKIFSK